MTSTCRPTSIIDDAEVRPVVLGEQVKRAFAALADEYADVSARLFADDPHLSVDPPPRPRGS